MRDHVFSRTAFSMWSQEFEVEQVGHTKSAAAHLVFIGGPIPREVVPIFTRGAFSEASSIMRW